MTRKKIKTIPVCTFCKSDDVVFDAWAAWNPETGNYELVNTFDDAHCNHCDGECSIDWVMPIHVKYYSEDEEGETEDAGI